METSPLINRCRACGATSYRQLTHRGADGVMRYSGVYCCSGCSLTFTERSSWRERRLRPRAPGSPTTSKSVADALHTP